jgi:uncharacterized SAM-binding protein YcdF (DUF218 family)
LGRRRREPGQADQEKAHPAVRIVVAGLALLLVLEAAVYSAILLRPPRPLQGETFDLLAVFGGDPARIQLGFNEARAGVASALVVSDSGQWQMERYFRAYGRPGKARIILEPFARTTDENARLVSRIIRADGFHRVLLITSWYHQPRAYLLLRLGLLGSGVTVNVLSTEDTPRGFLATPEFRGEYLKFWGSLARWSKSILRKKGLIPWEAPLPVD